MALIFVALGSNLDPERQLSDAVDALGALFGAMRLSPVYRNPAVGGGADFYNLVAELHTESAPCALPERLRMIERRQGRRRGADRCMPRSLDLDLLLYDDLILEEGRLRLPHPDIERYAFVLYPLAQLAGARRHPIHGRSYARMWRDFSGVRPAMQRVSLAWKGAVQDA